MTHNKNDQKLFLGIVLVCGAMLILCALFVRPPYSLLDLGAGLAAMSYAVLKYRVLRRHRRHWPKAYH
jgi:hypothetical protein